MVELREPGPRKRAARQSLPRGVASREAILAAALRVVGRDGLPSASLGAIAREAGTSKPAVLYHFGSRENLLHEMTARALRELQHVLLDIAREARPPSRTELTLDVTFAKENRQMLAAARELMALGIRDGVVSDLVSNAFDEVERTVAGLLPDHVQDPLRAASDIVRSVYGFLQLWLCHQDEDPGRFQAGALRVSVALGAHAARR